MILQSPHRRYNPLKSEWVLVSPNRTQRPWQGKQEPVTKLQNLIHDPLCYICPGNKRTNGQLNPKYNSTFVFPNDFPAITKNTFPKTPQPESLLNYHQVNGECHVISFSPRHDLTLADMEIADIEKVIFTWIGQFNSLSPKYNWVQIFENKGELMGCSNPHPHGQIWTSDFIPNEISTENEQQKKYTLKHSSNLLLDYIKEEQKTKQRIIIENENWLAIVPFWATWPYETMLLPKAHRQSFTPLSPTEITNLAKVMKKMLTVYDKLFSTSMPYSMGWHFSPTNQKENKHWQLHAHYYPPLLRSATVKKFMVGYEMLAESQRDITPEQAAQVLKNLA